MNDNHLIEVLTILDGVPHEQAVQFLAAVKEFHESDKEEVLKVKEVLNLDDSELISLARTILRVYNEGP